MKLLSTLAIGAVLATLQPYSVSAQTAAHAFTDPANLRGERVAPLNGRELPVDQGASGLQQMLRRLSTRASLMLIVAHPDDEDGGMLTFYSRGLGARAGMLTLNRGEGGQNAMTGDFEDALGLLRTQELLSAGRYSGITQMFGTEVDFGFSKTKEEAFTKWTHERVLYDAVRAVRIFRPLVIASVFVGGVTDGHGQHQVAGEIAQEVFKAAGDPSVFPELTAEGILPWQPLKVYARVPMQAITPQGLFDYATGQYTPARFTNYVTGEVSSTPPSADVVIHEGNTDPLLGPYPAKEPFVSYVQFAREGLALQRSQVGPGIRSAPPGVFDVSYHLYGSKLEGARQKLHEDSFFDGIDVSVQGIATLAPEEQLLLRSPLAQISSWISQATEHLNPENMAAIAPLLANALRDTDKLLAAVERAKFASAESKENVLHELRVKRVQLDQALAISLGLTIKVSADAADLPAGKAASARLTLSQSSVLPVKFARIWAANSFGDGVGDGQSFDGAGPQLTPAQAVQRDCGLTEKQTPVTRPYFFRTDIETPVYQVTHPALRDAAATPPAMSCYAEVVYSGVPVTVGAVALHEHQPVRFVPAASLSLSAHAQVFPAAETAIPVAAVVTPAAAVRWSAPPALSVVPATGETEFRIEAGGKRLSAPVTLKAFAAVGHETITEGYRAVGYGDLPRTNYYTPASDRVVPVDLKLPDAGHRRIGYVAGTGDDVPAALASIGLKPEMLAVSDLTAARLAQFDTVVLGVRTYRAHPELHGPPTKALEEFARSGGNVVVQYQTAEFTADDAPYPMGLGREAQTVVDETAAVTLLDSASPLLTTPNAISAHDFDGWVEERGHGFPKTWDSHYTALTETHDPGAPAEFIKPQEPQRGGLLTVALGKGRWTYLAFAVYRQLPEAVPGAFRLFVNLLQP